MANGWAQLGSELFGGPDPTAYDSGRLYTAQTEGALAKAEAARLDAIAKSEVEKRRGQIQEALAANGATPEQAMLGDTIIGGGFGSDYNAFTSGQLHSQEQQFRSTLADPNADPMTQFAAGQSIKGEVLNPYAQVGDSFVDLRAPVAPGAPAPLQRTALTDAKIGAENALAYQRRHPELNPSGAAESMLDPYNGAFGKPQPGEMANPNFDPALPASLDNRPFVPRPGSTLDPAVGGTWGTRERMMLSSVLHSALEAGQRLNTIMDMPSGANSGMLGTGIGGHRGVGILSAIADNMRWAISPDEVNQYNTLMMGQARNLANLENYGRTAPSQAQIDSIYQALALRPDGTETVEGKMMKMADFRNTVENALHTFIAMNPRMKGTGAMQLVDDTLKGIRQSVPFTMDDVNRLTTEQQKNPRATLGDVMKRRMLTQPVRPGQNAGGQPPAQTGTATARPDLPLRDENGWELMEDGDGNLAYVSPSGQIKEVK